MLRSFFDETIKEANEHHKLIIEARRKGREIDMVPFAISVLERHRQAQRQAKYFWWWPPIAWKIVWMAYRERKRAEYMRRFVEGELENQDAEFKNGETK